LDSALGLVPEVNAGFEQFFMEMAGKLTPWFAVSNHKVQSGS